MDEDLDLVALATIADLVPLRGENRRLARAGLRALASTGKPGLRALMRVARVDPSGLDAGAVGFRLAPRINAAGRLYRADAGVELLLTEDDARAAAIADELDTANMERRGVEQRIRFDAEAQVRELGPRSAYVLAGEGWHPGVIGIVASRIAEQTYRPTLLVALDPDTGMGTASGRSIPGFDLLAALHAAAPLLERYGGHRAAAGLTVAIDRIDELRDAFEAHAAATLTAEDLIPVDRVDAVVGGPQLGLALADELAQLEPCGMGNPAVNLLDPRRHAHRRAPDGRGGSPRALHRRSRRRPLPRRLVRLRRPPARPTRRPRRHHRPARTQQLERSSRSSPPAPQRHAIDTGSRSKCSASPRPASGWRRSSPATRSRRPRHPSRGRERELPSSTGVARVRRPCCSTLSQVARRCSPSWRTCRAELTGLAARVGGFSLASHAALARDPGLIDGFTHVVALDPPATADEDARMRAGAHADAPAFTHLAWGDAELRFAQQIHESEYGLRAALVPLYRALRASGSAAGEELERLLRGDGSHGRSAALAGRLVGVLEELGLVSLDRDLPTLRVLDAERTALERSAIFRAASTRHEDGQQFLARARTSTGTATSAAHG